MTFIRYPVSVLKSRLPGAALLSLILMHPAANALELQPRRWGYMPININVAGLGYATIDGDIVFDPVLHAEDVRVEADTWVYWSLCTSYGWESAVNGIGKDDRKHYLGWGLSAGYPLSPTVGLTFRYINMETLTSTGSDTRTLSVAVSTAFRKKRISLAGAADQLSSARAIAGS